jgi:4Fe-4S ferredoxin
MSTETTECKHPPKTLRPLVNFSKCEAKGPCIQVCPYDVFEMKAITDADYSRLNLVGKIKTFVHGRQKAHAVRADACQACGLCVKACPEKAISLVRYE